MGTAARRTTTKPSDESVSAVPGGTVPGLGDAYRSAFRNWEHRASVRVKPNRALTALTGGQGAFHNGISGDAFTYFPPELVPVVSHPLVHELPQSTANRILVQRLYQYLHFTTELEQVAVIPVATRISRGRSGLVLPETMLADAFRIATDEAWHAQFSHDMLKQVENATGIVASLPDEARFLRRLAGVRQRLDPRVRGVEDLLFAVVSETLISTILSDLPRENRLPPAIRDLVKDHAEDEGRHHAYFNDLLIRLWPTLNAHERGLLGPWIPELITVFLEPDYEAVALSLLDAGLPPQTCEQVLVESYPQGRVRQEIAVAAQASVRYFCAVGALDDPATLEAFAAAELLDT